MAWIPAEITIADTLRLGWFAHKPRTLEPPGAWKDFSLGVAGESTALSTLGLKPARQWETNSVMPTIVWLFLEPWQTGSKRQWEMWKLRLGMVRKTRVWPLCEFEGSLVMELILKQRESRHRQTLHSVVELLVVWLWQRKNPMSGDLLGSEQSGWVKAYGHFQWIHTRHGWCLSLDFLVYKMTGHPLGLWVARLWLEEAGEERGPSLDVGNFVCQCHWVKKHTEN